MDKREEGCGPHLGREDSQSIGDVLFRCLSSILRLIPTQKDPLVVSQLHEARLPEPWILSTVLVAFFAGDDQTPGSKMGKDRGVMVRKESSPMNGVQCIRYLINNSDVNSFPERSHWSTRHSPIQPVETTEHFLVSIALNSEKASWRKVPCRSSPRGPSRG